MTGGGERRQDLVLGGIGALPPGLSADLAILDLDYNRMQQRRLGDGGAGDHDGYLTLAERTIKRAYDLTGDDGICCVISRNVRDDKSGALAMLGTKVTDRVGRWNVCDEIIWGAGPTAPCYDVHSIWGGMRISPISDFSQIRVLAKNSPGPYRSTMLGLAELSDEEKEDTISSVWLVPSEPPGEYNDPVPRRVLSRLVLSYSEPGGLILDPYANDGMTAAVCEGLGRSYVCAFDSAERLAAAEKRICDLAAA